MELLAAVFGTVASMLLGMGLCAFYYLKLGGRGYDRVW